jgi:hypothetical protein
MGRREIIDPRGSASHIKPGTIQGQVKVPRNNLNHGNLKNQRSLRFKSFVIQIPLKSGHMAKFNLNHLFIKAALNTTITIH